jgi:hypothetical protein
MNVWRKTLCCVSGLDRLIYRRLVKKRLDLDCRNNRLDHESIDSAAEIQFWIVVFVDDDIELVALLARLRICVNDLTGAYRDIGTQMTLKELLDEGFSWCATV